MKFHKTALPHIRMEFYISVLFCFHFIAILFVFFNSDYNPVNCFGDHLNGHNAAFWTTLFAGVNFILSAQLPQMVKTTN